MNDEVKDATEGLWDKIKHPVFGPFASAWLLWNWQILFLFIHGLDKPTETIQEIQTHYLSCDRFGHLFWGPAISTLLFIVIGAYFRSGFISWNKFVEVQRNKLDARIEEKNVVEKELLTKAETEINRLKDTEKFNQDRIIQLQSQVEDLIGAFKGIEDGKGTITDQGGRIHNIKELYLENVNLKKTNEALGRQIQFLTDKLSTEKLKNVTSEPKTK